MCSAGMPSPTADNGLGRDSSGRFVPGNRIATGNPHAKRVGQLRSLLLDAVTDDDMHDVVTALVNAAKAGELSAIRELLDRLIGKATDGADLLERLEALERMVENGSGA